MAEICPRCQWPFDAHTVNDYLACGTFRRSDFDWSFQALVESAKSCSDPESPELTVSAVLAQLYNVSPSERVRLFAQAKAGHVPASPDGDR